MMSSRLRRVLDKHPVMLTSDDIFYLLQIAQELERLILSDHRLIDLSDTAYSAITNLYELTKEDE